MTCYNFNIKHFPFSKPLIILFYLLMVNDFFSPQRPFKSALSFNFTNFTSGDNITDESAFIEDQVIKLTGNQARTELVGRARYFSLMQLWDKASGNLTDFTTHFSFVIDSQKNSNYGDGPAFFLAPTDSKLPDHSEGAAMGLARTNQSLNTTDNHFVAVEFDIYPNQPWDAPGEHVGIDINSMKSVANVSWWGARTSIMEGRINEGRNNRSLLFSYIHNYEKLVTKFLKKFFSTQKTRQLRREIQTFQQKDGNLFFKALEHFNELLLKCPHHNLSQDDQVQTFYEGLSDINKSLVDLACGRVLMEKNSEKAIELFETLSENSQQFSSRERQGAKSKGVYEVNIKGGVQTQRARMEKKIDMLTIASLKFIKFNKSMVAKSHQSCLGSNQNVLNLQVGQHNLEPKNDVEGVILQFFTAQQ